MTENPIKLGIIADVQYCDRDADTSSDRYYRESLDRLREAVATFNETGVDLVVNLGDLIECDYASFGPVMEVLEGCESEVVHVPGNHDFVVDQDHIGEVRKRLAPSGKNFPYRYQLREDLRLLLLDATVVSLYATTSGTSNHLEATGWLTELSNEGKPNAKSYNGGLGDKQRAWLQREIADAAASGARVIVACHQPVFGGNEKFHLWDAEETRGLLSSSQGVVIAWLAGHSHSFSYELLDGVHHWQLAAMVDTSDRNAYAELVIREEGMSINGFGRQESLRLA